MKLESSHDHQMSLLQRTICEALCSPVLADERDDITRQRIVFAVVLREHYDALFNAIGGPEDRAAKWEELRHLMIEQGAHTLLDKDWKYVSGCYWQNIRKESIRRMAKLKVGAIKQPRPAQAELDAIVSDIISRRGPNSLETVLRTYGRSLTEEDDEGGGTVAEGQYPQVETEENGQQQQQNNSSEQQHPVDEHHMSSSSASPSAAVHHDELLSNQAALAQLVRNATSPSSVPSAAASLMLNKLVPDPQQCSSASLNIPSTMASMSTKQYLNIHQQQPHQHTPPPVVVVEESPSSILGKLVTKTHSLLLNGGFEAMAGEFEQQIKQLITGYKAWMFDQLFQQDDSDQTTTTIQMIDGNPILGGATTTATTVPKKRAKLG